MPREQINYRQIVTENAGTPNEIHTERPTTCVHVGWNRAGWVQVSLALPSVELAKWTASLSDDPEPSLFSEVLTRDDVNKMIRALRKARDQAYGSDA